jgi:hypothetical protein
MWWQQGVRAFVVHNSGGALLLLLQRKLVAVVRQLELPSNNVVLGVLHNMQLLILWLFCCSGR